LVHTLMIMGFRRGRIRETVQACPSDLPIAWRSLGRYTVGCHPDNAIGGQLNDQYVRNEIRELRGSARAGQRCGTASDEWAPFHRATPPISRGEGESAGFDRNALKRFLFSRTRHICSSLRRIRLSCRWPAGIGVASTPAGAGPAVEKLQKKAPNVLKSQGRVQILFEAATSGSAPLPK
jgi:hypothetical protein